MLTKDDLDKQRLLYEASTPGMWDWGGDHSTLQAAQPDHSHTNILTCPSPITHITEDVDYRPNYNDRWFISEAHNVMGDLLDLAEKGLLYNALLEQVKRDMERQKAPISMAYATAFQGHATFSVGDTPVHPTLSSSGVRVEDPGGPDLDVDGNQMPALSVEGEYPIPKVYLDADEFARANGFANSAEANRLISLAHPETQEEWDAFTHWKTHDGTKAGLLALGF